jgi:hypothetical protein
MKMLRLLEPESKGPPPAQASLLHRRHDAISAGPICSCVTAHSEVGPNGVRGDRASETGQSNRRLLANGALRDRQESRSPVGAAGILGSGTTLAAAEVTERVCYGIELDPKYVDVVVKRWQGLTGEKATLEGDGRTFDQIAEERHQEAV